MKYLRPDDKRTYLYVGKRKTSNNQAVSSYGPSTIVFLELLLHTLRIYQKGREHWYKKRRQQQLGRMADFPHPGTFSVFDL